MIRVLLAACLVGVGPFGYAREYVIKLDKENPKFRYSTVGPEDKQFDPLEPWRDWGTTARDVGNFPNKSSKSIRGIRFQTLFTGQQFSTMSDGGGLFQEVWMNSDRTDVIFRKVTTPVDPRKYFWM